MNKEKVTSREYKIMLHAERFTGDEQQLLSRSKEFWHAFRTILEDSPIDTKGDLREISKRRTINFLDTNHHRLRNNDYVFRERIDKGSSEHKQITLKFRHEDRYISQDRDMTARGEDDDEKTKFEEDLKPFKTANGPLFVGLYSFSTTLKVFRHRAFQSLENVGEVFPGLLGNLANHEDDGSLHAVGGFTAFELVIEGANFRVRRNPKLEAECALIAWYDSNHSGARPAVVEFSFRYGNDKENYTMKTAQRAYEAFRALRSPQLTSWVDPTSMTKTSYVYSLTDD